MELNNKIQESLNYWKEKLFNEYGKDHILNITLYGSQNYKIDTSSSDVDMKAIYVPSIREAVCNSFWLSTELLNEKNGHCEIKDIREMCKMYTKQNLNFLETLFTEYRWDNPLYKDIHYRFKECSEKIARYNISYGIKSLCGQALNTIKEIQKDCSLANKKIAKIIYLYLFLIKYIDNKDYKSCIEIADDEKFLHFKAKPLLLMLKTGNMNLLSQTDQNLLFNKENGVTNFLKIYFTNMLNFSENEHSNNYIVKNILNDISYESIVIYEKEQEKKNG